MVSDLARSLSDRQAVLLVGETTLGEDVLDRRRKLGEISLALDEIVRHAQLEGLDGRVLVALGGHHHDRDPDALGLELLEHLDAREVGHAVVEEEHVVVGGLQPGERLAGERDHLDACAAVVLLEGAQRERRVVGIVIGVEQTDRRAPEPRSRCETSGRRSRARPEA